VLIIIVLTFVFSPFCAAFAVVSFVWQHFCCYSLYFLFYTKKHLIMKRVLLAIFGLAIIGLSSCKKNLETPVAPEPAANTGPATEAPVVYYDFVISAKTGCAGAVLTINDCGNGSYTPWSSTTSCSGTNNFNGTVFGSGNPLLLTNPPTFINIGATYLIFNNSTTATRDVLSVIFKPGYTAAHKPTITYNVTTRKFTIVNAGNPAFVTVTKFSYTGLIAPGVIEFC
jgi:hypothetical protein